MLHPTRFEQPVVSVRRARIETRLALRPLEELLLYAGALGAGFVAGVLIRIS